MILDSLDPVVKSALDVLSVTTAVCTFVITILPSIAAVLTIVWTGLRIYEWFELRQKEHKEK